MSMRNTNLERDPSILRVN